MVERLEAPWTPEQVLALNRYQQRPDRHPFTCEDRNDGTHSYSLNGDFGVLVATPEGWVCNACDYRQSWAFPSMLEDDG